MKISQLAAQLFTVREHCKTAADLAVTARKVRAIGYAGVQISGVGPIPEEEIARIMREEGLAICATHEPSDTILGHPEKVVDRLQRLGCNFAAIPFPKDMDFTSAGQLRELVQKLDASGKVLRDAGLTFGYHNHATEFVRFEGAPVLDYIFRRVPVAHLVSELDTYYVHLGGGDVTAWCQKLRDRLPVMHIKDYVFTTANKPDWCEIGQGNLDWARIIPAAEKSGCQWFVVEQESCPGDPFASLQISFDYLKANFVA